MNMCYRYFLLFNIACFFFFNMQASTLSSIKKSVQHIVAHPVQTVSKYAKICVEGVTAFYATRMFLHHANEFVSRLKNDGIRADTVVIENHIKRSVLCFSLGLTGLMCGSWCLQDIKRL